MQQAQRVRCPKAMPLLHEGQRVTVTFKGKKCCGFVTVVGTEPISRYCVAVVKPPWEFDTFQDFVDRMVHNMYAQNGPSVFGYVYKRRDELEASVFGPIAARESTAIQ